ncbi:MAG: LacI family DNA-binding transcriptional regulator, partial [Dysosmobacter sp.]|nr:LacI family DNA-binding transcriptional regulator [Dysosmobacter sp.]
MAATLKQVAEAAGVSRGTVDRVLHGRGHVNPELEERVSRLLKEMGYQPNRLGRGLVMSGRAIKLGMICQFSETPFMKLVLHGAEQAQAELKATNTDLYIESIDSYDADRMLKTIDQMLERGVHGLALTPGNSPAIHEKMRQVIRAGIPIVTLNSDAPDTGRLAYVGLDNYRAGKAAAGLMSLTLRNGGTILPISGYTENTSHTQRVKGFFEAAAGEFPNLQLLELEHCYDID